MTTLRPHVDLRFFHSEITDRIIAGFYDTYDELGYGFLESNYANGLTLFLRESGLNVEREVPVEVLCRGAPVGIYRLDMVVEERVVVEIKAAQSIGIADERQVYNYLRATNFGSRLAPPLRTQTRAPPLCIRKRQEATTLSQVVISVVTALSASSA